MSEARRRPAPSEPLHAPRKAPCTDQPLRILLTSYRSSKYTGGQGVYLRNLSRALVERGHRVDVLSGPPYPELDPRVRLLRLPSLDLYAKARTFAGMPPPPRRMLTSYADTYEYLAHISGAFAEPRTFGMRMVPFLQARLQRYDIVHDNQTLCWGLLKIARRGLPVVGTLHHPITYDRKIAVEAATGWGHRLLLRRWYGFLGMQTRVARRLDPLIAISESTRRDAAAEFGLDPARIVTVPIGIDSDLFRPMPEVRRRTNRLIAVASADVPLKGLTYLIRAYFELLDRHPDLELLVIGRLREGPTARLIRELGIGDRVRFRENLTYDQLVRAYAFATVAVVPSVYEGFGLPAGEAMACGVPVVATDGGALPEVVGEAGIIVPAANALALAGGILELLENPARRATLGAVGRHHVVRAFQWANTAAETERVYRRALARAYGESRSPESD